eukprot:ctg_551.g294
MPKRYSLAAQYRFDERKELYAEVPYITALLTYAMYAMMIIIGHVRDSVRKMGRWLRQPDGEPSERAPLLADFEDFYTRRMYRRIEDALSHPRRAAALAAAAVAEGRTSRVAGATGGIAHARDRRVQRSPATDTVHCGTRIHRPGASLPQPQLLQLSRLRRGARRHRRLGVAGAGTVWRERVRGTGWRFHRAAAAAGGDRGALCGQGGGDRGGHGICYQLDDSAGAGGQGRPTPRLPPQRRQGSGAGATLIDRRGTAAHAPPVDQGAGGGGGHLLHGGCRLQSAGDSAGHPQVPRLPVCGRGAQHRRAGRHRPWRLRVHRFRRRRRVCGRLGGTRAPPPTRIGRRAAHHHHVTQQRDADSVRHAADQRRGRDGRGQAQDRPAARQFALLSTAPDRAGRTDHRHNRLAGGAHYVVHSQQDRRVQSRVSAARSGDRGGGFPGHAAHPQSRAHLSQRGTYARRLGLCAAGDRRGGGFVAAQVQQAPPERKTHHGQGEREMRDRCRGGDGGGERRWWGMPGRSSVKTCARIGEGVFWVSAAFRTGVRYTYPFAHHSGGGADGAPLR